MVPVQIQTGAKKEALGFRLWALGGEPAETRNAPKEGIEKEHENQPRLWVDPISQQILHFRQKVVAFRHLNFLEKIPPLRGAGKRVKA